MKSRRSVLFNVYRCRNATLHHVGAAKPSALYLLYLKNWQNHCYYKNLSLPEQRVSNRNTWRKTCGSSLFFIIIHFWRLWEKWVNGKHFYITQTILTERLGLVYLRMHIVKNRTGWRKYMLWYRESQEKRIKLNVYIQYKRTTTTELPIKFELTLENYCRKRSSVLVEELLGSL